MRNLLLASAVLLAVATPVAAFEVPQTRQEFVDAVAAGKGATTVETMDSDQPLDKVYALLEEKATACLDIKVSRTAYVGYVEHSSSDFNPTVKRVGRDKAEFTLQVEHNPRGVGAKPPAGGIYMMAADLRAIEGNHTQVVLYRSSLGVKKIVESLRAWVAGDPAPCPKLK